ncbi:aspartic proteinase PCS1-like [Lotus japonicus]|uniref:aspartic proteinase PCS1-like n=1 Tax=Lotus japonicus TaxID=34305 RepID=UPI00258AC046|nr:aspartic proteinase PCS1-like [Lotus japonicus]
MAFSVPSPVSLSKLCMLLLPLFFFTCSSTILNHVNNHSLSFPLTLLPIFTNKPSSSNSNTNLKLRTLSSSSTTKSSFQYSNALVVSLPIGTPPQVQPMVLDTGSQLSWIQCNNNKNRAPKKPSFDPALSSSFSTLPCSNPHCEPGVPDYTIPTTCDRNRHCHYSFFYADGTLAEGNLVTEKITLSPSQTTPPLILGCANTSSDGRGILGMNRGTFSFPSQTKIAKFSYCVPLRQTRPAPGTFLIGQNPASTRFRYVPMLTFGQGMPNLDPLAYTVPMQGIRIGGKRLNIPPAVFKPDAGGSGQTMIDSGSEFTFLVDAAYNKVREEIVRLVGPRLKKGYVYGDAADMCFDGNAIFIGRLIGDMVLEFEKGVEIVIPKERLLADVGGGVHCVSLGRSERLGGAANIIGNIHQQNHWVEFDLVNHRVGFGVADCSRSGK